MTTDRVYLAQPAAERISIRFHKLRNIAIAVKTDASWSVHRTGSCSHTHLAQPNALPRNGIAPTSHPLALFSRSLVRRRYLIVGRPTGISASAGAYDVCEIKDRDCLQPPLRSHFARANRAERTQRVFSG
jgi:hypothetical protein